MVFLLTSHSVCQNLNCACQLTCFFFFLSFFLCANCCMSNAKNLQKLCQIFTLIVVTPGPAGPNQHGRCGPTQSMGRPTKRPARALGTPSQSPRLVGCRTGALHLASQELWDSVPSTLVGRLDGRPMLLGDPAGPPGVACLSGILPVGLKTHAPTTPNFPFSFQP